MKIRYFTLTALLLLTISTQFAMAKPLVITVAGTGDSQGLLRKLAIEFHKTTAGRDIRINVPNSVGSSGGVKALATGRAALARTARPLKTKEKKYRLREFRFALSPIVIAVHPSVKGIKNISSQQIRDIYSGRIRNWQQLGGANKPIYAIDREAGDSSRTILEKHLDGFPQGKTWAKVFYTTPEAEKAIKKHQFTIGFLPLSSAKLNGLKILAIDGIEPTEDKLISGEYKYVSPFFIISKPKPSKAEMTFIDFLYSETAKQLIRAAGTVPVN